MFRSASAVLFLGLVLGVPSVAGAQWSSLWDSGYHDYRRNVEWPEPFLQPDRAATVMPFSLMIANGWRRQNLLSDYHFIDDGSQLNLAGETKVRWILTQQPPNRRIIFVQRGLTQDVSVARVAMVQRSADRLYGSRGTPLVLESDLPNDGWPADDIDATSRRFIATRPDPRLSNSSGGGGSSGSGGGSGSGSGSGGGTQ